MSGLIGHTTAGFLVMAGCIWIIGSCHARTHSAWLYAQQLGSWAWPAASGPLAPAVHAQSPSLEGGCSNKPGLSLRVAPSMHKIEPKQLKGCVSRLEGMGMAGCSCLLQHPS